MLSHEWIIPGVCLALACFALYVLLLWRALRDAQADRADLRRHETLVTLHADTSGVWATWGRW